MPCACKIPVPDYPDNADWGPLFWALLHGFAEKSGRAPIPADEGITWQKLLKATAEVLPCDKCRAHFAVYLKQHPPTLFTQIPYSDLKRQVKTWLLNIHNEINQENKKPVFAFEDLEAKYKDVNFQDTFWRLEPVLKKAIQFSGVGLMKWTVWVAHFKMMRSVLGV